MARQELARLVRACVALAALAVLLVPASADASRYAKRTLKTGSQGRDVKLFQKYLKRAGFKTRVTGYYGSQTARSEKRFERQVGRRVDGKATRADQRVVRTAARNGGVDAAGTGGAGYDPNAYSNPTARARLSSDGRTAIAPDSAPQEVKDAIAAANRITRKPYKYGGGHGKWEDTGYDCSGSVSYAMHGAGILSRPLDSTGFMSWGKPGKGRWITVYANSGHAYTVIAGLRFDTSAAGAGGGSGPRWRTKGRSSSGYTVRHPTRF
jgi:cell wall-associated NlpC family hydrolase